MKYFVFFIAVVLIVFWQVSPKSRAALPESIETVPHKPTKKNPNQSTLQFPKPVVPSTTQASPIDEENFAPAQDLTYEVERVLCEPIDLSFCVCEGNNQTSCKEELTSMLISIYDQALPEHIPEFMRTDYEGLSRMMAWAQNQPDSYNLIESSKRNVLSGYSCYVPRETECYKPDSEPYFTDMDGGFQVAGDEWQPLDDEGQYE